MKEVDADSVSLVELDRATAKNVARAREKPLLVTNRHHPWVWIVSHDVWMRDKQYLEYIPDTHPLVILRDWVDQHFALRAGLLCRAAIDLKLQIGPQLLCRALILQILYSIRGARTLYDSIGYNMVFRRFVGMDTSLPLWPYADFESEMRALISTDIVLELIDTVVAMHGRVPGSAAEFCVNQAFIKAWKIRAASGELKEEAPQPVAALPASAAVPPSAESSIAVATKAPVPYAGTVVHASRASMPSASIANSLRSQSRRKARLRY